MQNNIFLDILSRNEDRRFYYAALMFERFSEYVWIEEKNIYNVKHGCSHISEVINNISQILSSFDKDEILDLIGVEYIFILISSIYIHDIGMQAFYEKRLPHLDGKDNLSINDLEEIRVNHSDIIGEFITNLDDLTVIKKYFSSSYLIITNFISNEEFEIDEVLRVIIDYRRYIAIVSSYHNKSIENLSFEIERLCVNKKLCRTEIDFQKFNFVTALLQVGDALDMSVKRINKNHFITMINSESYMSKITCPEYDLLIRSMLCYIIDDIEFKVDIESNKIDIYFHMSVSNTNYTDHIEFIESAKERFSERLRRSGNDAVSIIQNFIKKEINIHLDGERINVNNDKELINKHFFSMQCKNELNFENLVRPKLNQLKKSTNCLFLYMKYYSPITDSYYGGFAINVTAKEETIINNTFFSPEEFILNPVESCCYVTSLSEVASKSTSIKSFSKYLQINKKYNVQSEIYYPLRHGNECIGYINLHFSEILSDEDKNNVCNEIDRYIKTLGFELVQLHQSEMMNKFTRLIHTFKWLPDELKESLIVLYRNKFYEPPAQILNKIKNVNILELKTILNINDISPHDDKFFITIHKDLFFYVFEFISKTFDELADVSFKIITKPYYSFVKICLDIEFMDGIISPEHVKRAVSYINIADEIPLDTQPFKELEYLMPLKSMVSLFGGKVNVCNNRNDLKISFEMLLPRKKIPKTICSQLQ